MEPKQLFDPKLVKIETHMISLDEMERLAGSVHSNVIQTVRFKDELFALRRDGSVYRYKALPGHELLKAA